MKTKIYRIRGKFAMADETKVFTKELKATNEENIYERIYSEFGSKHGINRNQINIDEIKEISEDEITDPLIKAIS
ncbi:50S ribosomal protein LX [Methanobrevibacter cuticularis]|uniref:Large ribosomal subunit protein eL20 n=1 Tax=Methanobrevibacter cuticularis TaxID=47311 RepID=A0A166EKQ2_9EURY|nr:50S ribosomal protein L18Ae [Methanobrevibacter cuticularis]KZX16763.1 50S ribosomal protein LX [Methanobrevibacter cuticularis]